MAAIEISNLFYDAKSQWSWKKTPILKDVNLSVAEGESFGFLGHNGAGKTTTIKCILNLINPRPKSEIKIFGVDYKKTIARKAVGYLPEQPYFYDHLTVEELLHMYAALIGIKRKEVRNYVNEALERTNISHKRKAAMRSLSKGQTQRVAMAQAIVGKPKLLILDEPFSGLDPLGRKEFADLIFELKREKTTIFMSSHILGDVEHVCDRVSIMLNGELQGVYDLKDYSGVDHDLYELVVYGATSNKTEIETLACEVEERGARLIARFSTKAKASEALYKLTNQGAEIESFQAHRGSLEEFFVKIVQTDQQGSGS